MTSDGKDVSYFVDPQNIEFRILNFFESNRLRKFFSIYFTGFLYNIAHSFKSILVSELSDIKIYCKEAFYIFPWVILYILHNPVFYSLLLSTAKNQFHLSLTYSFNFKEKFKEFFITICIKIKSIEINIGDFIKSGLNGIKAESYFSP